MGLDMFAFKTQKLKQHQEDPGAVILDSPEEETQELAYWRKFNALHNWMEQEYLERKGNSEFNCVKMQLTEDTLNKLEQDCKDKKLIPVQGFFFGSQEPVSDDEYQEVLEFIAKAREAIKEGNSVYYDSWW